MPLSVVFLGVGAFVATLIVIPLAQRVALLNNVTSMPRADRLHDRPTPYLGGVPIVLENQLIGAIGINHVTNRRNIPGRDITAFEGRMKLVWVPRWLITFQ